MRPYVLALILCLCCIVARTANADVTIQLGTESEYDPDAVCWKDPAGCVQGVGNCVGLFPDHSWRGEICDQGEKPVDATGGWRCENNIRSSNAKKGDLVRKLVLEHRRFGTIRKVELNGNVVKIFSAATTGEFRPIAGGDYVSPPAEGDSTVFFRLQPTCRPVFLDVPDAIGELTFEGSPTPAKCLDPVCKGGGLHRVLVATRPGGGAKLGGGRRVSRLSAKIGTTELVGTWSGQLPDALKLRLEVVQFAWRSGCLYSPKCALGKGPDACGTPCPRVRIPDAAMDDDNCVPTYTPSPQTEDQRGAICTYTCKQGPANSGFSLPTDVVFEIGTHDDSWTEKLVQADQQFKGFADRSDRQFSVLLPPIRTEIHAEKIPQNQKTDAAGQPVTDAQLASAEGSIELERRRKRAIKERSSLATASRSLLLDGLHQISHYDILASSGARYNGIWPQEGRKIAAIRIAVPGATCNDQISVQYFGEFQAYAPKVISLEDGGFPLEPPGSSFRRWWLGARASGAFVTHFDGTPIRAGGEIEALAQKRFFDFPIVVEAAVSYQLWGHGYEPANYDRRTETQPELPLNRLALVPKAAYLMSERWHFYGGIGPWISWPVNDDDYPLVGVIGGVQAEFGFQFAVVRALAAHLGLVMYAPEPVRSITTDIFNASAGYTTNWAPSFGGKFGFAAWNPL